MQSGALGSPPQSRHRMSHGMTTRSMTKHAEGETMFCVWLELLKPNDADDLCSVFTALCHELNASVASAVKDATHIVVAPMNKEEGEAKKHVLREFVDRNQSVVDERWLRDGIKYHDLRREEIDYMPGVVQELNLEKADEKEVMPHRGAQSRKRPAEDATTDGASSGVHHVARHSLCDEQSKRSLKASLLETQDFLKREHPEEFEAGQIQCAIQRSMLDCAIQFAQVPREHLDSSDKIESPEQVLGVESGASATDIRAAYREKIKVAHPDKGGNNQLFCQIRRAYLALSGLETEQSQSPINAQPGDLKLSHEDSTQVLLSITGESKSLDLKDHKALVREKFAEAGVDLEAVLKRQQEAIKAMALLCFECGAKNKNEQGKVMYNQCFYLSLAASYLGKPPSRSAESSHACGDTALHLKRVIETAALALHPEWADTCIGDDMQAFSDFLFFVLGSHALLSELSVAIFDDVSGFVEIYKGRCYPGPDRELEQRANMLILKYVPGHYKALLPRKPCNRPRLDDVICHLTAGDVRYVVTEL